MPDSLLTMGKANSPPGASPAEPSTPSAPTEAMDRDGLATWLTEAAKPVPTPTAASTQTAPETPPIEAEAESASDSTPAEAEPAEAGQNADDTDLSQSPEPDSAGAEEDEDSSHGEGEPTPAGVQKRLDKMRRMMGDLERKLERMGDDDQRLREENARLRTQASPPADGGRMFSNIQDMTQLEALHQEARELVRWCKRNPDGGTFRGREILADDVPKMMEGAEDAHDLHLPAQAEYLKHYGAMHTQAVQMFPWWKDRTSPEYAEAAAVLHNIPGIRNHPGYELLLGYAVEGKRAVTARNKPASKPKSAPPPPPPPPAAAKAPVDGAKAAQEKAWERLKGSGERSALADLLKARGL